MDKVLERILVGFKIFCLLVGLSLPMCSEASDAGERAEAFDQVWEHVNAHFYDPDFAGHDWAELGARFRDKAITAPSEKEFYVTLNTMLFALKVSHIGVIPDAHPEWIGAPAAFADGEVGLDIRIVDRRIVVTKREAGLGARAPGLKAGTVITRLNGLTFDDFLAEVLTPPTPTIPLVVLTNERAARELFADPGETVEITYLDEGGQETTVSLTAYARGTAITLMEGVPPVYLDFESRVIDGDIGYIAFNSFHRALTDRILKAMVEYKDTPGLIIDLRGNVGGDFNVRRAMAEHLIAERATVWQYRGRRGVDPIVLYPAAERYPGRVVFLVDELSASSAEELAGAMQALGRAKVVGNVTAGLVLVADVLRLDIGASLVFPIAETSFVNGYIPEGKGIVPDVLVPYDIDTLGDGVDQQLQMALKLVRGADQQHAGTE